MANNIHIENDYQNIFIVDPNKIDVDGGVQERNIKQEELIMYANLECNLQPRSKLIVGSSDKDLRQIGLGKINFLKPTGSDFLDTKWTELQAQKITGSQLNSELLGITKIDYKVSQPFVASFTINLEDIRGRALFESGNDSVYSAFFNLPYPIFYLTLKGWYGKAIRYQLVLEKFHGAFNTSSGNFEITLTLKTFTFSILKDLFMTDLYAVPLMYQTQRINPLSPNGVVVNNQQTNFFEESKTYLGYDKIVEVYKKYKSKGLLPDDFPELTIQSLINKLETFINVNLEKLGEVSLNPITDYEKYLKNLNELNAEIFIRNDSWFNKYLKKDKVYIANENNTTTYNVYTYANTGTTTQAYTDLVSIVEKHVKIANSNVTFGESSGLYSIPLNSNELLNSLIPNVHTVSDFNLQKTLSQRLGGSTFNQTQEDDLKIEIQNVIALSGIINPKPPTSPITKPVFFTVEGVNGFSSVTTKIKTKLDGFKEQIETSLSEQLAQVLQSSEGIGFQPTIRNIIGVLMASAEAYILLLEDVHTKAFNQRNNIKRQQCITNIDKKDNIDAPVYPWPQYVVSKTVDGVEKFEIQYPGDPNYINQTGANDYEAWPEVEFVEEYTRGFTQRNLVPNDNPIKTDNKTINRNSISGFDTPASNLPYSNLSLPDFFFEIIERLELIVTLNGFSGKLGFNQALPFFAQTEFSNINEGLKDENGQIINILKYGNLGTILSYENLLSTFPVNYTKYSNGFLTSEYLIDETKNNFKILEITDIPNQSNLYVDKNIAQNFIAITENPTYQTNSLDIYPFTNLNWCNKNLENGSSLNTNDVFSTNSSLFYNFHTLKISNFIGSPTESSSFYNKPVTNIEILTNYTKFSFYETTLNFKTFYETRLPKDYLLTEGKLNYTSSRLSLSQTTSIFNTPFFINSIQESIENEKNGSEYPYLKSSYLFLNSLPLSTTKEKYSSGWKTFEFEDLSKVVKENFISTSFNKYAANHGLPLVWIAKLGSIWYRYKNWKETGTDFMSNIWTNFDYANNYDPINGQTNTPYNIQNKTIVLQQNEPNSQKFVLGFYPKLINDFYYLINNKNLYLPTDDLIGIQTKINNAINDGRLKIRNSSGTTIGSDNITTPGQTKSIVIDTYNVYIKKLDSEKGNYVITPSFGLEDKNQISDELIDNSNGSGFTVTSLINNSSVYNGSVRLFWASPNYGYFDSSQFLINPPDKYLKKIYTGSSETQQSFELFGTDQYSNIEEIFSIFTKEELDIIEKTYLDYSKSNQNGIEKNKFYNIFIDILTLDPRFDNLPFEVTGAIGQYQGSNSSEILNKHLDVYKIISIANPKKYNKRIFSSVSSNPLPDTQPTVYYVENSLPTSGGTTTLSQSMSQYPNEWKTLETYVGFSTIPQLVYSDNGSFITDFFPTMNVGFTVENIIYYRDVIKVFATKKLENYQSGDFTKTSFTNIIDGIKTTFDDELSKLLSLTFVELYKGLPTFQKVNPYGIEPSKTEGLQSKVEKYEVFKSLNDTWIAGSNYNAQTLFEDFLFIDRANRNIGDRIYVDIFKVKNYLKKIDGKVFEIINSILLDHHFQPFILPGYINFYGCNSPSSNQTAQIAEPPSFADSLFGTFTTVDYQSTKTKFVCMYIDQASKQLDNPDTANGYNNDGFDLKRSAQQPLVDNLQDKKDYCLSNKVVGFAVDFGAQNQGVFKSVSVSQDLGKPTSESLMAEYEMANLAKGTQTSTQNVSLYNLYKLRSYEASVSTFGNVMIQPMMYFILRNMPLFAGTYMITSVQHNISPGSFDTSFTGTRMSVFTLPTIDQLFQSIKRELLKNVISQSKTVLNGTNPPVALTQSQISANAINNINEQPVISSNTNCAPTGATFSDFVSVSVQTTIENYGAIKILIDNLVSDIERRKLVYTIILLETDNGSGLQFYNNNLGNIPLTTDVLGGSNKDLIIDKQFSCLDINNISNPYCTFENVEKSIRLINKRFGPIFKNEVSNFVDSAEYSIQFAKCYLKYYPYNTNIDYNQFKETNASDLQKLENKIKGYFETKL